MAIISFTNYKRGQTTGCMSAVMRYTMQDKKTEFEGQQLVTGINCQPESVYADFMTTKRLYHKTDGVLFYHMVQSFPKGEAVDPVTAHAAALKLAEYYEGYEVLVCTHTDREHIHSHFLINSVNFDTGRKLHIAKEQLQELRQRNDMVCKEFSLPVFQPREQKQKTKTMTIGEYHTAARGQSKKLQLMNIINDCMRHASNREEFIALMESEGYKVRWEKSRKNITYTTPSGWQCRDRLLFGDKYLKENMEYEFRIREEIIYGRAHGPEPARAFTAADSAGVEFTDHAHCHPVSAAGGSDDADTEDRIHRVGSAWNAGVSSEPEITHRPDSGAEQHGGDPEIVDGDDHSAGTGWEEERKAFLQMAEEINEYKLKGIKATRKEITVTAQRQQSKMSIKQSKNYYNLHFFSLNIPLYFKIKKADFETKSDKFLTIKKKELPIGYTVTNEQSINCIKYDLTNDELVNLAKKKLSIISERELEGYEIVNTNITYDIKNDECTMTGAYVIK